MILNAVAKQLCIETGFFFYNQIIHRLIWMKTLAVFQMRATLIIFFESSLTLAFVPTAYAPTEFYYNGQTYVQGHGLGTVFLDWLLTTEEEPIGLQLNLDIFGLNANGHSTLTKEEQEAQRIAAQQNLSREYISQSKHFVQLWFGSRRDFNPILSCHQDIVDCNYVTSDKKWAVGISVNLDNDIIQKLARIEAKWVSSEIRVLGNQTSSSD